MATPRRRPRSVARQVFLLQVALVLLVVVVGAALAVYDARRVQVAQARETVLDVGRAVAASPTLVAAARERDPARIVQPFAERVRVETGADFVVAMAPDRTRWSHPDPARLGQPFVGDLGTAPAGVPFVQTFRGTLGPSIRSVVPVLDDGRVVALVSVGITVDRVSDALRTRLLVLACVASALLATGAGGAGLLSRRLRRQTHGLGELEITRMYEYYDAVLHAVREGLLVLDVDGRVQLANDEAIRLLDLPAGYRDRTPAELGLAPSLAARLVAGEVEPDEVHLAGERVLVVNQAPARWAGRLLGSVVTFRDHSELQAVTSELDSVRGLAETLRTQNHESANRLHTVVSLIELGRPADAVEFAVGELHTAQALADRLQGVGEEPVVSALLLGKTAQAAHRGVDLVLDPDSRVDGLPISAAELVTVLGNLLDNAIDAVATSAVRTVRVRLLADEEGLELDVDDSGPGLPAEAAADAFARGWSTKGDAGGLGRGLGLALVAQVTHRHGGAVTVHEADLGGARFRVRIPQ
ncbi:MAG: sensor histidine kinase [Sporichthyaceae bacterium]